MRRFGDIDVANQDDALGHISVAGLATVSVNGKPASRHRPHGEGSCGTYPFFHIAMALTEPEDVV